MINQNLHRQPAALDSALHRQLRLQVPITDWSLARQLNAIFLAVAEFGDACKEFPIVFVKAGKETDGTDAIAPIAVLGMVADDNLYLQDGRWRAQYMPAVLRLYPFCIGRIDEQRFAICLDMGFSGAGEAEGQAVFLDDGQPVSYTHLDVYKRQEWWRKGGCSNPGVSCKRKRLGGFYVG